MNLDTPFKWQDAVPFGLASAGTLGLSLFGGAGAPVAIGQGALLLTTALATGVWANKRWAEQNSKEATNQSPHHTDESETAPNELEVFGRAIRFVATPIAIVDSTGTFIEGNDALNSLFKAEHKAWDLPTPSAFSGVSTLLTEARRLDPSFLSASTKTPSSVTATKGAREIRIQSAPIDTVGSTPTFAITIEDVTGYALGKSIAAVSSSEILTATFDTSGTVVKASDTFADLLGRGTLSTGQRLSDKLHPADQNQIDWNELSRGTPQVGVLTLTAPQGEPRWLSCTFHPITDHSGTVRQVSMIAFDVSASQLEGQHDHEIANSIRNAQIAIEFDLNGTIRAVNDKFAETYGYRESEILGRQHSVLVGDQTTTSDIDHSLWDDVRRGQSRSGVFERCSRDGESLFLVGSYTVLRDHNGNPNGIIYYAVDITQVEQQRRQAAESQRSNSAAQKGFVSLLAERLHQLASGDLTGQIHEPYPDGFETLCESFNESLSRLSSVLTEIQGGADTLCRGVNEVSSATDDLARRTEMQASTLEESATALEEMTASVKASAERSNEIETQVATARENATSGGEVVKEAVTAMGEIESSSNKIAQIINVIDDIAFQTNLLALNAGVEAARAGDAGRGFAVVASEVRALAQRSSTAAKEIKALITTSTEQVTQGVALVDRTGEALNDIVGSVLSIESLITEVASASRDQSVGISEVNAAVTNLDQTTQQNAAMVEESTAATKSLLHEATSLMRLTKGFRFNQGSSAGDQRGGAGAVSSGNVRTQQSALKQALPSFGNNALKATGTDDWDEF